MYIYITTYLFFVYLGWAGFHLGLRPNSWLFPFSWACLYWGHYPSSHLTYFYCNSFKSLTYLDFQNSLLTTFKTNGLGTKLNFFYLLNILFVLLIFLTFSSDISFTSKKVFVIMFETQKKKEGGIFFWSKCLFSSFFTLFLLFSFLAFSLIFILL